MKSAVMIDNFVSHNDEIIFVFLHFDAWFYNVSYYNDVDIILKKTLSSCVWASYQIRKIASCACAGNAENVFPRARLQRKPPVTDPGMHCGTCGTHVPWCMSGSLTRGGGETFPAFPAHAHPQFYVAGKSPMRKDKGYYWLLVILKGQVLSSFRAVISSIV